MKKILSFLTIAAVIFTAQSQTQSTRDREQVSFGVKAGVNIATLTGEDTENLSSLTGFLVGAVVNLPISETFSVQPEAVFSAQGAKYSASEGYDGKFKLNYIAIPVMAKLEVAQGFSVEAGPQIGFLTSAKDEYTSPGDSGEDDIKDDVKGTDFGVNLGLGYVMESGLGIGARYNIGLSKVPDDPDFDSWKNGVLSFYLAFFFN